MTNTVENNKRIAKNTLLLYVRMLLLMVVNLYTSRVVLNALGINDFGIYNVVGGMVAMFSILSGSLSSAISRFITFELGKGNQENLNKIFSLSVTIQFVIGGIIVLFAETLGVCFLNVKMNIPEIRMEAANWVFQFSVFTFVINLISVPYNAIIIAYERMSAFAYISILEAIGKLSIAYFIIISPIDKLVFYAILMCLVALIIRFIYGRYCKLHFSECSYHFIWDKQLLGQMFSFAGWNFIGSASGLLRDHGGNIIINLFFGPAVNAARGIAFQVNTAIQGFSSNFMTALNPQITKSYALRDQDYLMILVFQGARYSFYMLLLLSMPIFINTHYILQFWLGIVPQYTVIFVQLVLIFTLCESVSKPLVTLQLATGKIRNYQIVVGGIQMLNLPISYLLLKLGGTVELVFIVAIFISLCCLATRLFFLKTMVNLPVKDFLCKVCLNVLIVTLSSAIIPLILSNYFKVDFFSFCLLSLCAIISVLSSIYYIGLFRNEREFLIKKIKEYLIKE